jgi:hypothetical protein
VVWWFGDRGLPAGGKGGKDRDLSDERITERFLQKHKNAGRTRQASEAIQRLRKNGNGQGKVSAVLSVRFQHTRHHTSEHKDGAQLILAALFFCLPQ